MSDDQDPDERPLTRREARAADVPAAADEVEVAPLASDAASADLGDVETPVRGTPAVDVPDTPAANPLTDASFPGFDSSRVPPRPPLPAAPVATPSDLGLDTGEHSAIREQWRAAKDELESHVSQARDHFDQANERIKQRTGRDLIVAILIGLAFGAALVASLIFVKWLFLLIALAAGLLATYELSRALRGGGRQIDVIPQLLAGTAVLLAGFFGELWVSWVVLIAAVAFISVWRMVAQMIAQDGRTYGAVLADVVVGSFVQVYVPFLTSVALMLLSQENGEWWVLSFVAIAVAADTCAYAAGLAFGKHPMAPRISPKKTWEGFGGAVAGSLLAGVLLAIFLLHLPWWCGLIFGAAILASATLGDLGESMLKRDLGIKDMSSWLPGHGGLLDRLDSILPSTVPALALSFLFAPLIGA
ncbi:Phosphatidate cytidylyltransferase [Microbacterium esteraromaticum]|uniref:Phosphatidate cytidylyltransferase n=1 Tax=Microbacterium esteraromaticum TaxID=57043 RepID=A0A1R4IDF1_9MICO|nr:phosphatidate cytidylyltransferase [Microbacterium esteraromaticum]SJN17872.1 Phosphatidate cytidylyltransferase [Microbacterium esteraromaticum]